MNATTIKNLVAKNGTVVHAQHGTDGAALCAPMMARNNVAGWTEHTGFMAVDADKAPVTCLDCCAKLGIEPPKRLAGAKKATLALDAFEVGQTIETRTGKGVVVKLTKSMVTYLPENGQVGKSGKPLTFVVSRSVARALNS